MFVLYFVRAFVFFVECRGLSFHLLGVLKDLKVDSGSEEKFADCVCELRM